MLCCWVTPSGGQALQAEAPRSAGQAQPLEPGGHVTPSCLAHLLPGPTAPEGKEEGCGLAEIGKRGKSSLNWGESPSSLEVLKLMCVANIFSGGWVGKAIAWHRSGQEG